MKPSYLDRVVKYLKLELTDDQLRLLDRYQIWLEEEALPAGGIGPGEVDRLESRHIADSLLFATYIRDRGCVWDLGSGVGLPGIPVAIALPDTQFVLFDRSGRRTDLARRAVRILGLSNVEIRQTDINKLDGETSAVVSRATLPRDTMFQLMNRLLEPGGIGVVGGSWSRIPTPIGWDIEEVPADVLDRPVWLLIMRQP